MTIPDHIVASKPLTCEILMEWFDSGYAGFAGKDGDYTDVVIDGSYDLVALESLISRAIFAAVQEEREAAASKAIEFAEYYEEEPEKYKFEAMAARQIAAAIRNRSVTEGE